MKLSSGLLATAFAMSAALAAPVPSAAGIGMHTFDDTNGATIKLQYSQNTDWVHETNAAQSYHGVTSYSKHPNASYSFSTERYRSFELYAGLRGDRGDIEVFLDGKLAGMAVQFQYDAQPTAPVRIYTSEDLDGQAHNVTVRWSETNFPGDWIAFDYVGMIPFHE